VPRTFVMETTREVTKPQMVERVIEVPKIEPLEFSVKGPTEVQYKEQIIEVPQVMVEERIKRVPRREIQERLIEVPKVEYVERIEYDDYVEYREVVVDKIIEVPEVEYHIREVEHLVPQNYVQDYMVDSYVEVPVNQMQEVAREELVPLVGRSHNEYANMGQAGTYGYSINMPVAQESRRGVENAVAWDSYATSQQCRQSSQNMGNSQNTQALPPTASGQYKQGITVKVPRGTFGPARTARDGGALFEAADRDRDGILTQNEALSALHTVPWQQSMAMSQTNLGPQSYRDYEAGRRGGSAEYRSGGSADYRSGGSADYNPFCSVGASMRSSYRSASPGPHSIQGNTMRGMQQESPTPPGSALGSYAMPPATSGGYGYSYGGGSMMGTPAVPGHRSGYRGSSGQATPPTPPAPWGGSASYDQAYGFPVTVY